MESSSWVPGRHALAQCLQGLAGSGGMNATGELAWGTLDS